MTIPLDADWIKMFLLGFFAGLGFHVAGWLWGVVMSLGRGKKE